MAKERMKWDSAGGFIGASKNVTFLPSALMYSLKGLDGGAASTSVTPANKRCNTRQVEGLSGLMIVGE